MKKNPSLWPYFLHSTPENLFAQFNEKTRVVVLDVFLGEGQNGIKVMEQIREKDPDEKIYLIIVTGHANNELLLKFINLRPNWFILKEYNPPHKDYLKEMESAMEIGKSRVMKRIQEEREREEAIRKLEQKSEELSKRFEDGQYNGNVGKDN